MMCLLAISTLVQSIKAASVSAIRLRPALDCAILLKVSSRLRFINTPATRGILPVVDEVEIPRLVGKYYGGLVGVDAQIAARLLQGWALPAAIESDRFGRVSNRARKIRRGPAWATERKLRRWGFQTGGIRESHYVTLPGGDEPTVDDRHVNEFRGRAGIPVASDEDGIWEGAVDVLVTHGRDHVTWDVEGLEFTFPRRRYDNAMRDLLSLIGEAPRLIDE